MSNQQVLPLGLSGFPLLRKINAVYVDKTSLIYELARRPGKFVLTRPRRFGKSLLISTFESLFKFGLEDFHGLAIEKHWSDKTYAVVRLDFSCIKQFSDAKSFSQKFFRTLTAGFGKIGFEASDPDNVAAELCCWLADQPSGSLVILVDEYDAPLTACLDDKEMFQSVRSTMIEFYSVLKSNDNCLRFLFITGITKLSSTSIFSELNNLTDITMDPAYGALLGYTEDEIKKYFSDYLVHACRVLNQSESQLLHALKENYNGFCFDRKAQTRVYCPWSVLNFFNSPEQGFINYWYASGGHPTVLMQYLKGHELEEPASYSKIKNVWLRDLETPRDYEGVDRDVLLAQAGYLTIQDISPNQVVSLAYPNQEIAMSMAQLYADKLLNGKTFRSPDNAALTDILSSTDLDAVVSRFNLVLNALDYHRYPIKDEATCRAYLQVLMMGADRVPHVENHTAMGRSDLEVEAGELHWVFEFKHVEFTQNVQKALEEALEQIRSRRYGMTAHGKKLICAALVFCAQTRSFAAWQIAQS